MGFRGGGGQIDPPPAGIGLKNQFENHFFQGKVYVWKNKLDKQNQNIYCGEITTFLVLPKMGLGKCKLLVLPKMGLGKCKLHLKTFRAEDGNDAFALWRYI